MKPSFLLDILFCLSYKINFSEWLSNLKNIGVVRDFNRKEGKRGKYDVIEIIYTKKAILCSPDFLAKIFSPDSLENTIIWRTDLE